MGLENIEHVVVLMLENRSFDNLLGWLYDNDTNPPKFNIPPQNPPVFEGLNENTYFNLSADDSPRQVFVTKPPSGWPSCPNSNQVPTPDPHEEFEHVTYQIFGKWEPGPNDQADMSGFLRNYAFQNADLDSADQIMQTYGPDEANVINDLARSFAVCDHWFASVPSQTWPNRGFVHSGCSDGHVNNDRPDELYRVDTIFNILQRQGKSFKCFSDTQLSCLTYVQFLNQGGLRDRLTQRYSAFKEACKASANADPDDKLPQYSFIEPNFMQFFFSSPNDYHPPHNICRGEMFLADVYQAIKNSPYRDKILLVILFDEHGGCYDHVPPPTGAIAPLPGAVSRDGKFKFDRYGVRVPAIVVSSYVEPGTVFRASQGEQPYDHTSLLSTLRDWLNLAAVPGAFLPSPRIANAPTLARALTRAKGSENADWPNITAKCNVDGKDLSKDTPLNDVQKSILAHSKSEQDGIPLSVTALEAKKLDTYEDGHNFIQPETQ